MLLLASRRLTVLLPLLGWLLLLLLLLRWVSAIHPPIPLGLNLLSLQLLLLLGQKPLLLQKLGSLLLLAQWILERLLPLLLSRIWGDI